MCIRDSPIPGRRPTDAATRVQPPWAASPQGPNGTRPRRVLSAWCWYRARSARPERSHGGRRA
eukprot:15380900-Alexandrium_andersonii.AAC.1